MCHKGRLYTGESRKLLSFTGNAPIEVSRQEKEVLRCNTCSIEFMSHVKNPVKWDNTARSSIVLQKVHGIPFYRLSKLQSLYNIPVAPSTLWLQCLGLWLECGYYIYKQLLSLAAECKVFYLDDTGAKILEVIDTNKSLPAKQQRSCHTTGICSETLEGHKLIIYITDNKYCGENFAPILESRENKEHYIKIVTDASSQNTPKVDEATLKKVIQSNCLAHGRQKFYDLKGNHPKECEYFLNEISAIYKVEKECQDYCTRKKLRCHKTGSSQPIRNIYTKIRYLFKEKLVEPNSDLGKAMNYWLRHKKELTRFLRVKGIKLDTNWVERALKSIILQRKNSLFFKTRNSAEILSGLHSIVKTCEENKVNAFAYLNWIQQNSTIIEKGKVDYMPWDYLAYMNSTELIAA